MQVETALSKPEQVDVLNEQAFLLRLQDTRRALKLSLEAKELALKIDYQKGLAYSLFISSLCHSYLGDAINVEETAFQALSLFQGLGDESGQAKAHNLIASIYHRKTNLPQALVHIQHCLEIRRKLGDRIGESGALNNIAVIYIKQAQYAQALDYLAQSLQATEESGDIAATAYALGNIAEVYSDIGDDSQALEYYQRSLELNRQTNNRTFESELLAAMGRIYARQANYPQAIQQLEHSLELARQTGNIHNQGLALTFLGISYQACEQYSLAEAFLDQGLQVVEKTGDRYVMAEALTTLGNNFLKQAKYFAALEKLQAAVAIAEQIQAAQLASEAHRLLSALYEALGDQAQALTHYRTYHQVWQNIHSQETARQLHTFFSQSEIEKAQREAEHQRQKSAELSQTLQALKEANEHKAKLVQQLEAQAHVLEQLAREDGLTGIANRRWLNVQLSLECERAGRFHRPLSVAMIDLDNFKTINDHISHQVGDLALQKAAVLFRNNSRSVDIIGRYGGDEFLLILVECNAGEALAICQRLCQQMSSYAWRTIHADIEPLTVSIGLCSSMGKLTPEQMIAAADAQLYRAKALGKNQVCAAEH